MYIIANGGMSNYNQNNTMDAILLTKNLSYVDGVLLDVRMSLDNVLMLLRSDSLETETLGKGTLSKMNYKDLRKVKFPSKIFKYYIPSLEEVLKRFQSPKIIILKLHEAFEKNQLLVERVLDLIRKYPHYKFFLETPSEEVFKYLKLLAKDHKIGFCFHDFPSSKESYVSFCDIKGCCFDELAFDYSYLLIRNIDNKEELNILLQKIDDNKSKKILLITDNPKQIHNLI